MIASRFAALAGVAVVCALSTAARAAPITVVFTAVDSFEADPSSPPVLSASGHVTSRIAGVVEGQAGPTTYGVNFFGFNGSTAVELLSRCDRMAAMAIHRPGRYNFVLRGEPATGSDGITYLRVPSCKLVRR